MTADQYLLSIAQLGLTPLGIKTAHYTLWTWQDGRTYPIRNPSDLSVVQRLIWIASYRAAFPRLNGSSF